MALFLSVYFLFSILSLSYGLMTSQAFLLCGNSLRYDLQTSQSAWLRCGNSLLYDLKTSRAWLCYGNSFRSTALSYTPATKGGDGGKALFGLSLVLLLKSQFSSVDLRTTTVCPSGDNAAAAVKQFKSVDPDYHCQPLPDLAISYLTSPLVFPGDKDWDPNFFTGPRGLSISTPIRRSSASTH